MIHNLIGTRTSIIQNIMRCETMQGNEDIYNYNNIATLRIKLEEVNASIISAILGIDRNKFSPAFFSAYNMEEQNMDSFLDTFVNKFDNIILPYFDVSLENNNISEMILNYYNTHYPLLPNKEEVNNNIKTFKITCNIPDEYIFFLMNIYDAVPDMIDERVTQIIGCDAVIDHLFPTMKYLVIRSNSGDVNDYGDMHMYLENHLRNRMNGMSAKIQSYMIDKIMTKFKSNILDTSPMFMFLGNIVR